ncbi:16S rRNA (cytosine(1402)-N(4))-methyltransferase RsmH [Gemmatimonas sp. UBA7669]|uniref:16S rRNA (cytosine(1402)-N(4))-methyltransferase RsmH n=1 Tax=Gemmatimonas sp. UBA7669 TaxID=1946568 RepID=UPI0025C0B1B7|nr:16S rRNA (cytosine(1402)-N(4))-methyltransferase RsmH [Gemmatimonas sp. UBA7669]
MSPARTLPSGRAGTYHVPVLLAEVETLLADADTVLDCTLGGGGHSAALLERGMRVTGVDRDPRALAAARERLVDFERSGQFRALLGNYADLPSAGLADAERFDGILLDLGVSSHQFDDPTRGFTFREGAPLDMRMGTDADVDAAELLNTIDEVDLSALLRNYADEPRAAKMAREIVRRRARRPFATADDLVDAIRAVLGPRSGAPDFARIFQAVRIAVNDELAGLERALPALRDRLTPGGVLAIIAYHSGEDRLVKNAFREWSRDCVCPPRLMVCGCRGVALGETLTRRPVSAADDEVDVNVRARSARLRAWRLAR